MASGEDPKSRKSNIQSILKNDLTQATCSRCGDGFLRVSRECVCPNCKAKTRLKERKLTNREEQIAQLIKAGMMNKEIAFYLNLSEGTIKQYIARMFGKLKANNRTELAVKIVMRDKENEKPGPQG